MKVDRFISSLPVESGAHLFKNSTGGGIPESIALEDFRSLDAHAKLAEPAPRGLYA